MKRNRFSTVVVAVATALVLVVGIAQPATGAPLYRFGVGSTTLAVPATGARYIYVSPTGSDLVNPPTGGMYSNGTPFPAYKRSDCLTGVANPSWVRMLSWSAAQACPEPTASAPLKTMQAAVLSAKAGDVIVVRKGTYVERVGYAARQGTIDKRIVLQNYPGERVDLLGWLNLRDPDYWTITGLRFGYDAVQTATAAAIVSLYGGTGWVFANNEVHDSRGYSNLLIETLPGTWTTDSARVAAAPQNYTIAGNCIRNANGAHASGTDHNIYLKPSVWSSGGIIERNLMSGAPNGGNIKAAGSSNFNEAPTDVEIRYNTLLNAGSGIIVGQNATDIQMTWNVIGLPYSSDSYDGGVKTYALMKPGANGVKDNVISGYTNAVRETGDLLYGHIYVKRTLNWPVTYTGSISSCNITLTDSANAAKYGHKAS